jgi:hypothetical protein
MNDAALIRAISDSLGRLSTQYSENIAYTGGLYTRDSGFYLYVGVEGTVNFKDTRGLTQSRHFIVGYHPIKMIQIVQAGTTATDLAACFN